MATFGYFYLLFIIFYLYKLNLILINKIYYGLLFYLSPDIE